MQYIHCVVLSALISEKIEMLNSAQEADLWNGLGHGHDVPGRDCLWPSQQTGFSYKVFKAYSLSRGALMWMSGEGWRIYSFQEEKWL